MRTPSKVKPTITIPLIAQETDWYCGPAVTQMLLSHLDKKVTQSEIVAAARIKSRIQRLGSRPDHLAKAITVLYPDLQFWYKQPTTTKDLISLVKKYKYPVAVNWQGLFYDTEEEQKEKNKDDENGHYSVVIGVDEKNDRIFLADPYKEVAGKPRVFSLKWFEKRWWDIVHERDVKTKEKYSIRTKRLAFVIAPKTKEFPRILHMKPSEKMDIFLAESKGK